MVYCGILWYTVVYRALPRTCTLKVAVPTPAVVLTTQVYVPISTVVIARGKEILVGPRMRIFNGGTLSTIKFPLKYHNTSSPRGGGVAETSA